MMLDVRLEIELLCVWAIGLILVCIVMEHPIVRYSVVASAFNFYCTTLHTP